MKYFDILLLINSFFVMVVILFFNTINEYQTDLPVKNEEILTAK